MVSRLVEEVSGCTALSIVIYPLNFNGEEYRHENDREYQRNNAKQNAFLCK